MDKQMREELIGRLIEINVRLEEDWKRDDDKRSAGCYKLINVIINVLQSEKDDDHSEYYAGSRLSEAILHFVDFFETDLETMFLQYLGRIAK